VAVVETDGVVGVERGDVVEVGRGDVAEVERGTSHKRQSRRQSQSMKANERFRCGYGRLTQDS
jgi:uncharacterized protein YjlB